MVFEGVICVFTSCMIRTLTCIFFIWNLYVIVFVIKITNQGKRGIWPKPHLEPWDGPNLEEKRYI